MSLSWPWWIKIILGFAVACAPGWAAPVGSHSHDGLGQSVSRVADRPANPAATSGWIPLTFTAVGNPAVAINVNGFRTLALLDTGATAIALDQRLVTQLGLKPDLTGRINAIGGMTQLRGASGVRIGLGSLDLPPAKLTIVPNMRVFGLKLENVSMQGEFENRFMERAGVDAMLGMRTLRQFNIILDLRARQAFFAPSGVPQAPLVKSRSGLQLSYGNSAIEVAHVMEGSPAAKAGWRVGERICRIDGAAAATVRDNPTLRRWGTDRPGRIVRFEMCEGQMRSLTLAEFY